MSLAYLVCAFFTAVTLLTSLLFATINNVYAQGSLNITKIAPKIGVRITSPHTNQTVPIGPLSI